MYARALVVPENSISHVFFRCHDRRFFLEPEEIKKALLLLWAKNARRYEVEIFEFIIMDNHADLLVRTKNAESLGNFMRTVNSQIATRINKYFGRDSQAIRERYKSPIVTTNKYILQVIQYIWLNRHVVNKSDPATDPFCSASWRINQNSTLNFLKFRLKERRSLENLLVSLKELPIAELIKSKGFIRHLLDSALDGFHQLNNKIFTNGHTIGDSEVVRYRGELLAAFRREKPPDAN